MVQSKEVTTSANVIVESFLLMLAFGHIPALGCVPNVEVIRY